MNYQYWIQYAPTVCTISFFFLSVQYFICNHRVDEFSTALQPTGATPPCMSLKLRDTQFSLQGSSRLNRFPPLMSHRMPWLPFSSTVLLWTWQLHTVPASWCTPKCVSSWLVHCQHKWVMQEVWVHFGWPCVYGCVLWYTISRLEVAMGHHRNLIIKQEQGCSSPLCWSLSLLVLNLFAAVTEVCSMSLVVVVSYCM